MKNLRYVYLNDNIVNVINAKVSTNSKIGVGYIIQTYHFDVEQIKSNDITLDNGSCLDCPLSYNQNQGKSGGCYTHKGNQLMGLKSMIRSLNKKFDTIEEFRQSDFDKFINTVKNTYPIDLVRFGAYGEPILLSLSIVDILTSLSKKTTGYTHQWDKKEYNEYKQFFMASTHDEQTTNQAKKLGFRSFIVAESEISSSKAVNCPASKESKKQSSCIKCGLCNGIKRGIKKDVYILKH